MSIIHSPAIPLDSLVFFYDSMNINSWKGAVTTNIIGTTMSIYNNVPAHVTAVLEATTNYFREAPVYKLTLTPTTETGVSYLTAGNNPGIGVVTSGGGGTGSTYTGHSIFFKSTVKLHTTPIYTHYSNIPGYQSSTNYNQLENGWNRAHVIWYDTITRSDGKYWAINPANAELNVPVVIYWAGPFREDRNDSTFVSNYTKTSRSNTQSIIDLVKTNTVTTNSLTYNSNGTFSFNGSNYLTVPFNATKFNFNSEQTIIIWMKNEASVATRRNPYNQAYGGAGTITHESNTNLNYYYGTNGGNSTPYTSHTSPFSVVNGETAMVAITRDPANTKWYKNGVLSGTRANPYGASVVTGTSPILIGTGYTTGFIGNLDSVMVYTRALSEYEILQTFAATRNRYGL